MITLQQDKFSDLDYLYMSVTCEMDCAFILKIELDSEHSVLPDDAEEFLLDKTRIIKYKHVDASVSAIEFWAYSYGNIPFTMVFSQSIINYLI